MEINTTKVRELLDARDDIDQELQAIFNGGKEKKANNCGNCGEPGHSARTCSKPKAPLSGTLHLPKGDNAKKGGNGAVT